MKVLSAKECYDRAAEARAMAEVATSPDERSDLQAAHTYVDRRTTAALHR